MVDGVLKSLYKYIMVNFFFVEIAQWINFHAVFFTYLKNVRSRSLAKVDDNRNLNLHG